jgi:transposase
MGLLRVERGQDRGTGAIAMPAAVPIRTEHSPEELRRLARRERDGRVSARLLGVANALDGLPRGQAARLAGLDGKTLQRWIERFTAEGIAGRRDRPRPGRPCAPGEGQRAVLKALILRGPDLARDGCVAGRLRDLCRPVECRSGVASSATGMLRLLHSLDLSWQKARPLHPEADLKAQARCNKACPA